MRISNKTLEIDPSDETFGKDEFEKLAKLMNWYTPDDSLKKIMKKQTLMILFH